MQTRADATRRQVRFMAVALIGALLLVFVRTAMVVPDAATRLTETDSDSIMRFLLVRDWLAGQSWFDTSIARVVPPEGLSLHWSRYVDLGIAGLIGALSVFVPADEAQALAAVIWPSLLLVAFLGLTAVATYRLFGPRAATVAILCVVLWRLTGFNYFGPMRIDHHGVQILLLGVVVFTLVIDGPALRRGIVGGIAAALSLAVGLENLLPIAVAGLILVARVVAGTPRAATQLVAYGLALPAAAIPLHIGQTAPSEWLVPHCDELGPPVLGLVVIAAAASVAIARSAARLENRRSRLAVAAGVSGVAAVGAWQVMGACPNFPYGNLPDDIREMISAWITEALPAYTFVLKAEPVAFSHFLPLTATTLVASLLAWHRHRAGRASKTETRAVATLLVFAWMGTLGSHAQTRLTVVAAPAVPILLGYAIDALLDIRAQTRRRSLASLGVVAMVAAGILPGQLHLAWSIVSEAHASGARGADTGPAQYHCRRAEVLESLNALPPGRVLTPIGLGPPILYATDHTLLSSPYHRSVAALGNGMQAFIGDRQMFFDVLERSDPDYVVMCNSTRHARGAAFVNDLVRGESHDGLVRVNGIDEALVVLEVRR